MGRLGDRTAFLRVLVVLAEGTDRYFTAARRRLVALIKYSCISSNG